MYKPMLKFGEQDNPKATTKRNKITCVKFCEQNRQIILVYIYRYKIYIYDNSLMRITSSKVIK